MMDLEGTRCVLSGGLAVERAVSVLPGVDLWWMPVQEHSAEWPSAWLFLDWLSPEERERMARFRFAKDRQAYLAKRVLVRGVLSAYMPVEPADWRFAANEFGKPRVAGGGMEFSLTRSGALAVCAVSRTGSVGVDVEDLGCLPAEMPEWVLAPGELAVVRALSGPARREAFLGFWTLKEALVKALGCGLRLPVERVCFHLAPAICAHVPEEWKIGSGWRFRQMRIDDRYSVAIACN